jgi:hypothetical protein
MKIKKILRITCPIIIVFGIAFLINNHDASSKPNDLSVNYYQKIDIVPDIISSDSLFLCVTNIQPDYYPQHHYCIFAVATSNDENQTFVFQSFNKDNKCYWKKLPIPIKGYFTFHFLGFTYDPICSSPAQEFFLFSCELEVEDPSFIDSRTFCFNINTQKLVEKL